MPTDRGSFLGLLAATAAVATTPLRAGTATLNIVATSMIASDRW